MSTDSMERELYSQFRQEQVEEEPSLGERVRDPEDGEEQLACGDEHAAVEKVHDEAHSETVQGEAHTRVPQHIAECTCDEHVDEHVERLRDRNSDLEN